jgi:two-component system CheB/CheR fusion protein
VAGELLRQVSLERASVTRSDFDDVVQFRRGHQARSLSAELDAANHRQQQSLAVLSHELRGPLGAIRNAIHVLGMQNAGFAAHQQARMLIDHQVDRMTRLVDDLLEVTRMGNNFRLRGERLDLRRVVNQALESAQSNIAEHNHRLATSLPDAPVWLQGDPGRLEQVFVNLLVNAAKYTDAGGELTVTLQQEHDEAIVRVRDSGIGIAPDMLLRVFDPFMQVDHSARRSEAGLGIGLAVVRNLVELHGGRVSAASAGLGQGSEFTVRLPAGTGA